MGKKLITPVKNYFKNYMGILIGLLVLGAVISINTPVFLTVGNLTNVVRQISNNMFLACAITMILIQGGIDLSAGAVVSLSSVMCVWLIVSAGVSMWLAIPLTLVMGAFVGSVSGIIIYKTNLPPFIVTFSVQSVCQGLAFVWTGAQPVRITDPAFTAIGAGFIGPVPLPVVYMFVVFAFVWFILNRTKLGRHIYATGGNVNAAAFSGVNIRKVRLFVYAFSGFMAAFAGVVLSARMYSGQPSAGADGSMDAIASVVLGGTSMGGGVGRIGGTLIGALVIGIMNNGLNLAGIDSYWQYVCKGIIVLVAVYVDFVKKGKKLAK